MNKRWMQTFALGASVGLGFCSQPAAAVPNTKNMLANPDFTMPGGAGGAPLHWSYIAPSATEAVVQSHVHSFGSAIRQHGPNAVIQQQLTQLTAPVVAGDRYRLAGYFAATGGKTGTYGIGYAGKPGIESFVIGPDAAVTSFHSVYTKASQLGSVPQLLSTTFVAAENGNSGSITFYELNNAGNVFLSDVSLTDISAEAPEMDSQSIALAGALAIAGFMLLSDRRQLGGR